MFKVLISDSMSEVAQKIFEENKITVDVKIGLSEEEIIKIIPEYDAIVVRSATKVTKKIILAGLFILIFFSLPIISNKLILYLEKDYSLQNISNIDEADAIVVLSGMVRKIKNKGYKSIAIQKIKNIGIGKTINDRLYRASNK